MVNKDTIDKELSEKKRRKASSSDVSSTKPSKEDVYENVISHEEQEAQKRSPEKDIALFHHTCGELKKLFEDIASLKKENTERAKQEIQEKRIQGSLIFVVLKKLNRLDKVRIRAGRDALHKEKLRVDSNRLQLQNLLYEANHLEREVQRCYQFKSQDEEIDLISEDEFYANAPEAISRPVKTKSDEHARRLARLEWELQQRKELSTLCRELTVAKESAAQDISLKTDRLDSLAPCLEALLKATKPLQTALDMEIENEWEVQKSARLLPRPLYLVYANLSAFSEACEPNLVTSIEGDEEEARQLEEEEKNERQDDDDNQDSDNEENDAENRKKHYKRLSKSDVFEIKKTNLLKPHPLSVTFMLKKANSSGSMSITLRYFAGLGFVTAKPEISITNTGVTAGDVISSDSIFNCLYPDDFGDHSPNPKTIFQLKECGLDESKLMEFLLEQKFGKPYKWTQRLCGLDFIQSNKPGTSGIGDIEVSHVLVQDTVPTLIKLIKSRWQSRLGLYKQIYALENKNIDLTGSNENIPVRISSSLVQWTPITWDDYISNPVTQKFADDNLVGIYDMFYRAIVTRGSAKLECLISISSNFPVDQPLWVLCLSWNGKHDASNNPAIRDMEYWINLPVPPKSPTPVLAAQLKRAMSSLDIFLETEGPLYNPAEFTQDKTFLKPFRGRQRSRPYKIVQTGSTIIYKQI